MSEQIGKCRGARRSDISRPAEPAYYRSSAVIQPVALLVAILEILYCTVDGRRRVGIWPANENVYHNQATF